MLVTSKMVWAMGSFEQFFQGFVEIFLYGVMHDQKARTYLSAEGYSETNKKICQQKAYQSRKNSYVPCFHFDMGSVLPRLSFLCGRANFIVYLAVVFVLVDQYTNYEFVLLFS